MGNISELKGQRQGLLAEIHDTLRLLGTPLSTSSTVVTDALERSVGACDVRSAFLLRAQVGEECRGRGVSLSMSLANRLSMAQHSAARTAFWRSTLALRSGEHRIADPAPQLGIPIAQFIRSWSPVSRG